MGFHSICAYFTGYKYEPDPEVQPLEEQEGRQLHPDMVSIVETIIREKAEQEPEEQAATAEGDVTFLDLMQQHEEADTAEAPPPLPSVLDGPGSSESHGSLFDTPQDRLIQDDAGLDEGGDAILEPDEAATDEAATDEATADESDVWLSEMGLMGQGDMPLERSLQGQPSGADRLGLDDIMFGDGQEEGGQEGDGDASGMDNMFGGEPGYEDLVGEVLGDDQPDEGKPEFIERMEDLLPVDEEDIVPTEGADRGFLKSVLLADERMAEIAVRKVLASDVTININVGDGESGDEEFGEGLEDAGEELGEGLEDAADELGEKLEGAAEELGGEEGLGEELDLGGDDLGGDDLGGDELGGGGKELDEDKELFGGEAESILRRVLANEVTININIGDGEEVILDAPDDLFGEPEFSDDELSDDDEEMGFDEEIEFGEELGEELGEEQEDLGEEFGAAPKKGDGESFDELDDLENVFQSGDENDKINEFGI